MLEIKDLSIFILDRYLVKELNLVLNNWDKLAIIGEEGNGKSTLLKSILGICDYSVVNGTINLNGNRIGYLEQSMDKENLEKLVYDFLFVDEPTNDLDIETLEWLENFINSSNKPIMYVSHDETLLSKTANMILHLEQTMKKTECKHTLLKGSYDNYVHDRLRFIDKQIKVAKSEKREFDKQFEKYRKIMQKVEYQQNTITRRDPHGGAILKKKMHSLKSQEKRLNSKELIKIPDVEESINFFFEEVSIPRTKRIIDLNINELKVDDKILCKNIKLEISGNTHLCFIGNNGVGKTTLIKEIYYKLKDRNDIKVGYMPQMYDEVLSNYEYVLDFICPNGNKEEITKARLFLGNMKFTKEEMITKINNLSNGTKAKLFLVKLVLDKCNVLILDEPTNHLDLESITSLNKGLCNFQGEVLFTSRDYELNSTVANRVIEINEDGKIKDRSIPYEEYIEKED